MDSPVADIIDETFNRLSSRYGSFEEQIDTLPPVIQNFLLVVSAQGVIDNGGYRYFFGADWPGNPPYSKFIGAYQAIGCEEQAKELERVVGTFPFRDPHLHKGKRKWFMRTNYDQEKFEVRGWGDKLCGDETVWEKLALYCDRYREELA